ncbi:hypothetical protein SCLCIDRAFT_1213952 [Scleroderma citrinum Foug A]|uniref:Uncharacterized protein n=1 Tax=Scleroderma citrinum Foug A TaxID=1036808 RepID=A0A0C3AFT0_9AGAM|nr:hypothetical protein SCLCIDRAFT_1213952 [Scleroderma citrinum Foug A]
MDDDNFPEQVSTPPKQRPLPTPLTLPVEMSLSKEHVAEIGADTPCRTRRGEGRARHHVRGYMDHSMTSSLNLKRTPPGSPVQIRPPHGLASTSHQPVPRIRSYSFAGNSISMNDAVDQSMWFDRLVQNSPVGLDDDEGRKSSTTLQTTSSGLPTCSVGAGATMRRSSRLHDRHQHCANRFRSFTVVDALYEEPLEIVPSSQSESTMEQFSLSQSLPTARVRDNQIEHMRG